MPSSTATPAARSRASPAPSTRGSGSWTAATTPAAASASASAWARPAARWKPSPTTRPSRTRTAPTIGLGLTRPRPPSASATARSIQASPGSRSVATTALLPGGVVEIAPGMAAQGATAASFHPDCHRRPLSSTGSTPAGCGRGSRALTAGGDFHPAPETRVLRHQQRTPSVRGLEAVGAAVHGIAGALLALGHVLELGGGGDELAVVGEGPLGAGGDAERDRDD